MNVFVYCEFVVLCGGGCEWVVIGYVELFGECVG